MKRLLFILIIGFLACEEVVEVDLPAPQNLVVVQGWVTDSLGSQPVRLTRSNGFSDRNQVSAISDAEVIVQARTGEVFTYTYQTDGYYHADTDYRGTSDTEYRLRIVIDTVEIRSEWDMMPEPVPITNIQVDSFEENDPDNSDQQITIYYPKITTKDPENEQNYYRWVFYKNDEVFNSPEPITIQNDRLFDGNLIPNNFQIFNYASGDRMTVQLLSISATTYNYLAILKSQITTLGTSSGTTPAIVSGNLKNLNDPTQQVLGYFGTVSSSLGSIDVE